MQYRQLTLEQRYQIHALRANGNSNGQIAKTLKVHRSTIGRELKRNFIPNGYRPGFAQKLAMNRRIKAGKGRLKIKGELKRLIESKLRYAWSPEQISGRLKKELSISISAESIYRHIVRDMRAGGKLRYALRLYRSRRRRYTGYQRRLNPRDDRKSIDLRPESANARKRIGHWERDLVEGKRGKPSLLTIIDRRSRYALIRKIKSKTSVEVSCATKAALRKKPHKTITNDNGVEFSDPLDLEKKLKTNIYFCRPYASWQRGSIENLNGLIRQYFPKKTDFSGVTANTIQLLQNTLNCRPRKTLNFLTPHEVFHKKKTSLFD